jgi:hypothetical protein
MHRLWTETTNSKRKERRRENNKTVRQKDLNGKWDKQESNKQNKQKRDRKK